MDELFIIFLYGAFFYGSSFTQAVSSLGNRSKLTVQLNLIMAVQKETTESSQCSSACRKELLAPQLPGVKKSTASMSVDQTRWWCQVKLKTYPAGSG